MEYKNVFISIGIVLIALIGITQLIGQWNNDYSATAGSTLNRTFTHMQQISNDTLISTGRSSAIDTQTVEGTGQTSSTSNLIQKSLSTIKRVPQLLGLVPSLLNDAASIIGVPTIIVDIIVTIFFFVFALTFAYLLLIGAKGLL